MHYSFTHFFLTLCFERALFLSAPFSVLSLYKFLCPDVYRYLRKQILTVDGKFTYEGNAEEIVFQHTLDKQDMVESVKW